MNDFCAATRSQYELLRFLTKIPGNLAVFPRKTIEGRFAQGGGTRENQCGGPLPEWGGVDTRVRFAIIRATTQRHHG